MSEDPNEEQKNTGRGRVSGPGDKRLQPRSEEHRRKISEAVSRRWQDPEVRERITEARTAAGRSRSPEKVEQLADFQRELWRDPQVRERIVRGMQGKPHPTLRGRTMPPEVKEKISGSMKGRTFTPEHRENLRQARLRVVAERRAREAEAAACAALNRSPGSA